MLVRTRPAFLLALAASLALHTGVFFLSRMDLPHLPAPPPPLLAEIKPPPPRMIEKPPVPEPAPPAPLPPPRPKRPPALPKAVSPATVPVEEAAPPIAEAVPKTSPESAQPKEPEADKPAITEGFPTQGRIRYHVFRGEQGFQVGRAEYHWDFSVEEGNYLLSSLTETSGLVAWFKSVSVELESRGSLAAGGLRPTQFTTRKNGQPTRENAHFDWEARQVTLERDGSSQNLPDGAQDILSLHFQLGFIPLSDGLTLNVVTGRKLERHLLTLLGEELLETPAGYFRTLHVRVQTDSITEFWLAEDRFMLPVKVRYFDKKGGNYEQVITELDMP